MTPRNGIANNYLQSARILLPGIRITMQDEMTNCFGICIYCLERIVGRNDCEHVFPSALGCPNHLILNSVCTDCNRHFGSTIEQWFAIDSPEGIARRLIPANLRQRKSRKRSPVESWEFTRRMDITLDDNREIFAELNGAQLYFTKGSRSQATAPGFPIQLRLADASGKFYFFTKQRLSNVSTMNLAKALPKKNAWIFGDKDEHDDFANWLINNKVLEKWELKSSRQIIAPGSITEDINLRFRGSIDLDLQRCVAKMAFNYFCYVRGPSIATSHRFDLVRNFIIGNHKKPIVHAHHLNNIVQLPSACNFSHQFKIKHDRNQVFCDIKLFDVFEYTIKLTEQFDGLAYNVGHKFQFPGPVVTQVQLTQLFTCN